MTIPYIRTLTDLYSQLGYQPYQWTENPEQPPFAPVNKPLSELRIGLVASGGVYVAGQTAFHYKDDTSFRSIPKGVSTRDLRVTHFAYDMTDARKDPNVVFPVDTLRHLAEEGVIGGLADHLFAFMGGIYSARKVREDLAPRLTDRLLSENVDAVLLVPV